jgi:tetratricopeptide (TPR) repeat protein
MPRRPGTHVDDAVAVGRRLRQAREEAGLSQRDLSFDGCTAAYISRVEAGARIPSLQVLRELGRQLGVSAEYLAKGAEPDAASTLIAEAEAATRFDELDRAQEIYERLLLDEGTPPEAIASAFLGLGEISFRRGKHAETVQLLERAREGDLLTPEGRAWAADRLGRALAMLGDYETSLATFEGALEDARESEDEPAQLRFATLLGNALVDGGNLNRAAELLAAALPIAERASDPLDLARLWWTQSRLHIQRGNPDLAARYALKAIDLLDATEHSSFAAAAFQLLARIENDRGNGAEALALLDRGVAAVNAADNPYYKAMFELERARALVQLDETAEAGSVAMRAAGLLSEASPPDAAHGYKTLADVFSALDEPARALELYELAIDLLPESDPFFSDVYTGLGELLEAQGREQEALQAYKAAAKARIAARR